MDSTIDELICVCIARQVADGDLLAQGLNTPLVMAGLILAKLTHAPSASFVSAIGQGLAQNWSPLSITRAEDGWQHHLLTSIGFATAAAEFLPTFHPKEFFRPGQVDASGNFNNIRIRGMRLPGSGGIPDVTPVSPNVYLYVPRHSKVVFSERLEIVSGVGHDRGPGPVYCVSDRGQFDWATGRMRLVTFHAGESPESVQRHTGFVLDIAPDVHETPPPRAEDLRLLREVIDPLGVRKLETLSGAARKDLLRQILEKETSNG